jgi:hypothetical protein
MGFYVTSSLVDPIHRYGDLEAPLALITMPAA